MPKNRQYTNLVRTPPSMAWLINERAKLKGMIERRQKQMDDLPREIVELQSKLDALDAVIPLHEVKVDPKIIKGTQTKRKALGPYGLMTRVIYEMLKKASGQPVFTSEIALEFMRRVGIPMSRSAKVDTTIRVRYRLKEMCRDGNVIRHHDPAHGETRRVHGPSPKTAGPATTKTIRNLFVRPPDQSVTSCHRLGPHPTSEHNSPFIPLTIALAVA